MNTKEHIGKLIRGWLPKEPILEYIIFPNRRHYSKRTAMLNKLGIPWAGILIFIISFTVVFPMIIVYVYGTIVTTVRIPIDYLPLIIVALVAFASSSILAVYEKKRFVYALILTILLLIAIAWTIIAFQPSPTLPPVEVTACSINPSEVTANQLATITCITKSNYENSTRIYVKLEVQPAELASYVSMSLPSNFNQHSDDFWGYAYDLPAMADLGDRTLLNASLPSGIRTGNYTIVVTVYNVGSQSIIEKSTQIYDNTLTLVVNST